MVEPNKPHIPFSASGSYPVRSGNLVHPLIDGEPAFRRICEAVEAARHSVWVTVAFIRPGFRMPDDRGTFFDLLDRAKERGLDVRVIFWRQNLATCLKGATTGTHAPQQRHRYSITLSARAIIVDGISWPSAAAVLRLMANSNLVGCSTGKSAGFAPLSIRSTYLAAFWNIAGQLGP